MTARMRDLLEQAKGDLWLRRWCEGQAVTRRRWGRRTA